MWGNVGECWEPFRGRYTQKQKLPLGGGSSALLCTICRGHRDAKIEELTGQALALKNTDPGGAARVLTWLKGIGIPTASAVLAVADPKLFGIVDFRVWDVLRRWQPTRFPSKDRGHWPIRYFLRCLVTMRELAQASGLSCREVDMALWQMDKEVGVW